MMSLLQLGVAVAAAIVAPARALEMPSPLASLASGYARSMATRPLLTKMGTSAAIFGSSDLSAQKLEKGSVAKEEPKLEYAQHTVVVYLNNLINDEPSRF